MKNSIPAWLRIPALFLVIVVLVEFTIDTGDKLAFIEKPEVALFLIFVLLLLIGIEAIVRSLENILYQTLDAEAKARYNLKSTSQSKVLIWIKESYARLRGGKEIEEEHEIILDHNYDGIRELDNDLPPWWLYGFYASIIFAFIYMAKYHIFDGENQYEELQANLEQAKVEIEEYKKGAKDLVDFNTVTLLADASDLKAGKTIYEMNCVACHKADGGGGIGPNLADEHWILGGGIKNVFKTISEGGRAGKGMIAWKQSLKPAEMAQVASYVLQFQGTAPTDAKAAEGDVWTDEDASK